jgi:eukaryotic-like serine/threonine-protein kinase
MEPKEATTGRSLSWNSSLEEALRNESNKPGRCPFNEAVDTILQVVAGLNAAFQKGVLHRDIKPANCFVEADGTVKVGDYGLAKSTQPQAESELTTVGTFMGTPAYSSPEQIRGEQLDVRSDIYSVGIMLYFLLTARLPFEKQGMSLIYEIFNRRSDPPDALVKSVPKPLSQVVLKCVEKEPGNASPIMLSLNVPSQSFGPVQ